MDARRYLRRGDRAGRRPARSPRLVQRPRLDELLGRALHGHLGRLVKLDQSVGADTGQLVVAERKDSQVSDITNRPVREMSTGHHLLARRGRVQSPNPGQDFQPDDRFEILRFLRASLLNLKL